MSSEWQSTTLGAICNAQGGAIQTGPFGSQLHTSDYKEHGVPVVMPTNIGDGGISEIGIARIDDSDVERLSQHKLHLGDIVFSRRGDVTKNALIQPHEVGWLCGTGCLKVRLGDKSVADERFISYHLRSPRTKEWLVRHAVGATMPNLNTGILASVPIMLPPLHVQLRIGEILGSLDDCIAILRETNATLEAMAQAIFKSWFVDFEPVRAKAEGRQPERMDAATAALFPDAFDAARSTPKGWRTASFTDVTTVISGGTPKTSISEYWGGGIPWFSVVDAPKPSEVFVIGTEKNISAVGLENSPTKLLSVGTTIISARGTVGRLALVGTEMAMNQSCYGLRGKVGDSYFTYFRACLLVDSLQKRAHGSVFDTITRDTLSSISVVQPDESVIFAFEDKVSPLMEEIKSNLFQSRTLAEIRDTLLPKLISGEIRLPEAESIVRSAVNA